MKAKDVSIRRMLFTYLFIFVIVLIVVLWLFQTVFLMNFYRAAKTRHMKSVAKIIEKNIDSENLYDLLQELSERDNSIGIVLFSQDGDVIFSPAAETIGAIRMPAPPLAPVETPERIKVLINRADEEDDLSFIEYGTKMEKSETLTPTPERIRDRGPFPGHNGYESIHFMSKAVNKNGESFYTFINTFITPVDATVMTLRYQLTYISIILVVMAFILSFLISKKFAKPIMEINEVAKQLTVGNYDVTFNTAGYSEINELNDTLNNAAFELSRVESLRRELLANVSHDLRTPLTMITGFAEMIRDLPGENTPDNAQIIIDESNRLTRLVGDLLDISKIEYGSLDTGMSVFCLSDVLKNTAERIETLLTGERRIIFEADDSVNINANESQIIQVIYNLIANALNYSDGNVIIKQLVDKNKVRVEVHDSGQGIADIDLPYVWDRYYKATEYHKRTNIGTGLGLSIVKGVIERHAGTCGVTSTLGAGSVFWFELDIV